MHICIKPTHFGGWLRATAANPMTSICFIMSVHKLKVIITYTACFHIYSTTSKDSRLTGVRVTVSFYPLSEKKVLYWKLIAFWSHYIWQFFDTEVNAGACDNVTPQKKQEQQQKKPRSTTPWLSFSINNTNLCRVAKSSNQWLTISKHFCHLFSL